RPQPTGSVLNDAGTSGGEAIAGPAHGLDETAIVRAFSLQSLAQTADMHVDRALLDIHIATPDMIEQLPARVGAFAMGHEEFQQPELGRPHVDGGLAYENAVAGG